MTITTNLTNQVAVITGATSGLGRRFAEVLAANGARVALTGRRADRLDAAVAAITNQGGMAHGEVHDVTATATIDPVLDRIEAALGPVDILVNNSGVGDAVMAVDVDEALYDRVMDTNAKGAFFMAQRVGRRMIARGAGGRIVNIASIASHTVLPSLSVYCMSKAALAMMTKALAREWARYHVNVNAICPGYIETEINADHWGTPAGEKMVARFPRRRVGVPSDLDAALLMLVDPDNRFMTGTLIDVDDGQIL